MSWVTEYSMWILFALLFVTAVFLISFAARSQRAKREGVGHLHSDAKNTGTVSIKRSDKV